MSTKNGQRPATKYPSQAGDPGRFSVRLSADLGKQLRHASFVTNVSVSDIIAAVLEDRLEAFVKKHPSPIERLRPGTKLRIFR